MRVQEDVIYEADNLDGSTGSGFAGCSFRWQCRFQQQWRHPYREFRGLDAFWLQPNRGHRARNGYLLPGDVVRQLDVHDWVADLGESVEYDSQLHPQRRR